MKFLKIKGFFKKLFFYQTIIYFFIITCIFLVLSFLEKKFWSDYLLDNAIGNLKTLTLDVIRTFGREFGKSKVNEDLLKVFGTNFEIKEMVITDAGSNILFSYGISDNANINLPEYKKRKDNVQYRVYKKGKENLYEILIPYISPGQTKFVIKYTIYFQALDRQIRNINIILIVSATLTFVIVFIFSYVFAKKITVPIEIIKEKAKSIKEGNYNIILPLLSDEFEELGRLIEMMAKEIRNKHEELILRNKNLENALEQVLFLQKQVLNFEKMAALGKISAGMSHEIDNPLGIIIGHAELILEELPEDSPIKEDVEVIIKEGLRIKKILRSLLDFAKPKESKIKKIELSDFLKKILENFSFQKIFKKIKLKYIPVEVHVLADEEKLHQVLVNIIINAIQAMPDGGNLFVQIFKENQKAQIKIVDEGIGIPEEVMSKIFDPFFSTKKDGTGLGLAISKNFIEEMGGEIKIISEENKGTTVIVSLPIAE